MGVELVRDLVSGFACFVAFEILAGAHFSYTVAI